VTAQVAQLRNLIILC